MKRLLGDIRRADESYHMIPPGASVAVGLSGGKDSMALMHLLKAYSQFEGKRFTLRAVTVTNAPDDDVSHLSDACNALDIPLSVARLDISKRLKDEKNPCALCARMRRGALIKSVQDLGCDTLALGHHRDDAVQTLVMSALNEGRLRAFQPKIMLENGVAVVRPLLFAEESAIERLVRRKALPVCPLPCPYAGNTQRQETAHLLARLERTHPDARDKLAAALRKDYYRANEGESQ